MSTEPRAERSERGSSAALCSLSLSGVSLAFSFSRNYTATAHHTAHSRLSESGNETDDETETSGQRRSTHGRYAAGTPSPQNANFIDQKSKKETPSEAPSRQQRALIADSGNLRLN